MLKVVQRTDRRDTTLPSTQSTTHLPNALRVFSPEVVKWFGAHLEMVDLGVVEEWVDFRGTRNSCCCLSPIRAHCNEMCGVA